MRFVYALLPLSRKPGKLARDTVILTTGLGLRSLAQAAVFVVIARVLGSEGYGAFSAALAVAGVWVHFCSLGGQVVLIRDVARDPESFPRSWAQTFTALGLGTVPVLLVYLASIRWLLPEIPWSLAVSLGLGELLFFPFANAAACAYQGFERMGRSARLMLAPVLLRLLAAFCLLAAVLRQPQADALTLWGGLYAGAALLGMLYAHYRVWRDLGRPVWPGWKGLGAFLRAGLPFTLTGGAHKLYVDADKFLLAGLATLEATGHYSAGYRLVDLASLPLYSLLAAVTPRLFRAGGRDRREALLAVLRLVAPAVAYCLAVAALLTLAAPWVPLLLGEAYLGAVAIIIWLAWLPLVSLPRLLLNQTLFTSDAQHLGMGVLLLGALVNISLNLWWIPLWGWWGAVAATYAAELAMILILLGMISWKIWNR